MSTQKAVVVCKIPDVNLSILLHLTLDTNALGPSHMHFVQASSHPSERIDRYITTTWIIKT